MTKVSVLLKLMPKNPSKGFEKTISEIKSKSKNLNYIVHDFKEQEIAFGIKNLLVLLSMDEESSFLNIVEKEFSKLDNVSSLEIIRVSRI